MTTTSHLALTLLEQSQARKDVTVNEALARIDAVLNTAVTDYTLATPPASPSEGDVYIVAASATDDWLGQENAIAYYDGGVWRFITPREGISLWSIAEGKFRSYFNGQWQAETNHWRQYDQSQTANLKSLTDAATINWDLRYNQVAQVTLGGSRTLANPTNAQAGGVYHLIVRQDGSGGNSLSFDTSYHFPLATAPSITSAANAVDMLTFIYDGNVMLGVANQNMA